MRFLPHKIFIYHLYIFQLEEYDILRYLKSHKNKGTFPPSTLRKSIVWTQKAELIAVLAFTLQFICSLAIAVFAYITFRSDVVFIATFLVILYMLIILSFMFQIFAALILKPLEIFQKNRIVNAAKKKIQGLPDLEIIGITGSYGKTTMKETVYTILKEQFNVVKTEGNNNTPLGIARTILNKIDKNTEIFVVEMGEYVKGDVAALCEIAQPHISIITGINEAHLERYKTMENAISTKFEIVEYAKKDATIIMNADDKLILDNYPKYIGDHYHLFFSSKNHDYATYKIRNEEFMQDGSGQSFEVYNEHESIGTVKVPVIAEYIKGNVVAGVIVARMMGMKEPLIRMGISQIKPVEHRLQPRMNANNILVIDDTYNGNSDGVREGIALLKKFESRRKVYVTPGLVETGALAESIHLEIGKQLASAADLVILIRNSVTGFIYKGLKDAEYPEDKIIWYDNSKKAYNELFTHLQANDVVLLQNDWTDNYS